MASDWVNENGIFINLPTDQLIAITSFGEASGDGAEGMLAVTNVIRNRTLDKSFYDQEIFGLTGDAYKACILKKYQFSMYLLDNSVRQTALKLAQNFDLSNSSLNQAYQFAQMALDGALSDNVSGATFYYAPSGVSSPPSWASIFPFVGQVGSQLFFSSGSTIASAVKAAGQAVEAMVKQPSITTLILLGLGAGITLQLVRKKK